MKKKVIVSLIATICFLLGLGVINSQAVTYVDYCGENVMYMLDSETGAMTIFGTGDMTDYSDDGIMPWYSYRSYIKSLTIEDGVTSIVSAAFDECSNLTSVTIPDSVITIGSYAFDDCTSLKSITVPDSVTSIGCGAFSGCNSIEEITLPFVGKCRGKTETYDSVFGYVFGYTTLYTKDGVEQQWGNDKEYYYYIPSSLKKVTITDETIMPYGAFCSCNNLTSITIGDKITSIGAYAFAWCNGLTSITIPDSVTSIGADAFTACGGLTSFIINDGVVSIGADAFNGCLNLTSITIPVSVKSIGGFAFDRCWDLKNVYYEGDLEDWMGISFGDYGANPMWNADNIYLNGEVLTGEVVIPDGVTSVGDFAFSSYDGITGIIIPDSVTSIGRWAFKYCNNLTDVTIPDSVMSIGEGAFYGCINLTNIIIPDSVTSIGNEAFYECTGLTNISLGKNIISIGEYAFAWCSGLTNIIIPDKVISIGKCAFKNCTGLMSVIIPDSVTSIGEYAFYYCTSLTSLTIGEGVTEIGNYAFYNCESLKEINWNAKSVENFFIDNYVFAYAGKNSDGIDVTFGDGVKKIPAYCFYSSDDSSAYHPQIISVTMSDSVTHIGVFAFFFCLELSDVYYAGTQEEWKKITISSYNEKLTDATIHYNWKIGVTYTINGNFLMISPTGVSKGSIVSALVLKDGVAKTYTWEYAGSGIVPFNIGSDADIVKIFVWESLKSMTPVIDAVTVK